MEVRLDTYLWAIRMFRSRTLATEAIKGGKVKMNLPDGKAGGETVKASHIVKIGERYQFMRGEQKTIIEVTALTDKRGNFETAKKHYADHSPPPEQNTKLPSMFFKVNIHREKGSGRPTKKERRDLEGLGWG